MTALTLHPPKLLPAAATLILGGSLILAATARIENFAAPPSPPPATATTALNFIDLPDGGVAVHAAADGALVATIPARDDGFLRMTLRLLAAARARQNIGRAAPFTLTKMPGGRLRLADPATGLTIELEAFGPSNVAEFATFFVPERQP
jgi:putative photosynthetic complex assembly protein